MKKFIALLTAIVLGATMLCGCGNTADDLIVSDNSAVTLLTEDIMPTDTMPAETEITTEATTEAVTESTTETTTEATTEATTTATEATTTATTKATTTLPADSAISYESLTDDEKVQKFSFNIFSEIVESGENSVFSPLSAYYALGMLSLGATDESAEELQGLLGMTADEAAEWCYEIIQEYSALSDDSTTVLSISNGVFIDDRFSVNEGSDDAFSNLENYYQAECKTMRLSTDATREYINSWISESTDGMIPSFLSENLDDSTMMVLVNALLLDAEWARPFDFFGSYWTTDFTTSSGEVVTAEYFGTERNYDYIKYDGVTGIIMDYADGRLKFVALMPDDGDIDGFLSDLTAERFNELLGNVQNGLCNMHIPRYKIEAEMELDDALSALGLSKVYNGGFDNFGEEIFLSKTIQKAVIEVDVWGTKAAAVTAEPMVGAAITYPEVITFNHSFFYAVYDSETGIPLFMGVVDNPT